MKHFVMIRRVFSIMEKTVGKEINVDMFSFSAKPNYREWWLQVLTFQKNYGI